MKWTLASWENAYIPKNSNPQTVKINVTTDNGSSFATKRGRIGIGLLGRTGMSEKECGSPANLYEEQTFGGSVKAGIELDTGKPFITFDPPLVDQTFTPISLMGVFNIAIWLQLGPTSATVTIKNTDTGEVIRSNTASYPAGWNWTGTHTGCILYYGVTSATSDTVWVKDFSVDQP